MFKAQSEFQNPESRLFLPHCLANTVLITHCPLPTAHCPEKIVCNIQPSAISAIISAISLCPAIPATKAYLCPLFHCLHRHQTADPSPYLPEPGTTEQNDQGSAPAPDQGPRFLSICKPSSDFLRSCGKSFSLLPCFTNICSQEPTIQYRSIPIHTDQDGSQQVHHPRLGR